MTYHFELNNRPNKQGRFSVLLRITENRKSKRVSTSIELSSQRDWNKVAEQVRKSEPFAETWNNVLTLFKERAKTIERTLTDENGTPTIEQVIAKLQDRTHQTTLLAFATECKMEKDNLGTQERWGQAINKMQLFLTDKRGGVVDIPLKEITPVFVDKYTQFLQKQPNYRDSSKGLSPNTIAKELKVLRAIVNKAITAGLMKSEQMPENLRTIKETRTKVSGLEVEELNNVAGVELQVGSKLWNARNLYFFSLYCCGMRLGDLLQLRWGNIKGDRLQYTMDKVDKAKDIGLLPVMQEILNYYRTPTAKPTDFVFPYLSNSASYAPYAFEKADTMPVEVKKKLYNAIKAREHKIDISIKELAQVAGVRPFTFHTGRHSFAMRAIDMGIDSFTIKEMLNHSSLVVTEQYLQRFDHSKEDTALLKIWGQDEQSKVERAGKLIDALKQLGLEPDTLTELLTNSKS